MLLKKSPILNPNLMEKRNAWGSANTSPMHYSIFNWGVLALVSYNYNIHSNYGYTMEETLHEKKKRIKRESYARHRLEILARMKKKYENPKEREKIAERGKIYRKENKEAITGRKLLYCKNNIDRRSCYDRWRNMKERCLNKNHRDYKKYGFRGIKISEEFLEFRAYFEYVKSLPKPKGFEFNTMFHLDRINNSGNYERGNLRWVTVKENLENSSNPKNNPNLKGVTNERRS